VPAYRKAKSGGKMLIRNGVLLVVVASLMKKAGKNHARKS
jgi:hypothetical protein